MVLRLHSQDEVLKIIIDNAKYFPHGKLMMLYGDDFAYPGFAKALNVFKKTEEMFRNIEAKEGITVKWATASDYFNAIAAMDIKFPTFHGDFLPYMCIKKTKDLKYWTGFYSLLPDLKRKIYETNEVVRFTEIVSTLVREVKPVATGLNLCTHHDAITATCRPGVANFYRRTLSATLTETLESLSKSAKIMLEPESKPAPTAPHRPFVIYNALNWKREDLFQLDSEGQFVEIKDPMGIGVPAQVIDKEGGRGYRVYFRAILPALSINLFTVYEHTTLCDSCASLSEDKPGSYSLLTPDWEVIFGNDGFVVSLEADGEAMYWSQKLVSFDGKKSGAYIFFPREDPKELELEVLSFKVVDGPLFTAGQTVWRRKKNARKGVFDSQLILIPKNNYGWVKWEIHTYAQPNEEIMISIDTPGASESLPLYTFDSVSWRQRKYLRPGDFNEIGRNFYPISGAAMMGGKKNGVIFVPFQPLGVGTYNGKYYVHLQRSLKQDDDFGLSHHIEDTSPSAFSFRLLSPHHAHDSFMRLYHESKLTNALLSLRPPFTLTLDPVMSSPLWHHKAAKHTGAHLGLDCKSLYLSSVTTRDKVLIVRFLNFADSSVDITWPGVAIGQKLYASKYAVWEEQIEMKKNEDVICPFGCEHSAEVELMEREAKTAVDSKKLRPRELGTFRAVAFMKVFQEFGWVEERNETNTQREGRFQPTPAADSPKPPLSEDLPSPLPSLPSLPHTESPSTPPAAPSPPPEVPKEASEVLYTPPLLPDLSPPIDRKPFLGSTEAITHLEYSLILSLSIISLLGMILYYRARKYRSE